MEMKEKTLAVHLQEWSSSERVTRAVHKVLIRTASPQLNYHWSHLFRSSCTSILRPTNFEGSYLLTQAILCSYFGNSTHPQDRVVSLEGFLIPRTYSSQLVPENISTLLGASQQCAVRASMTAFRRYCAELKGCEKRFGYRPSVIICRFLGIFEALIWALQRAMQFAVTF